MRIRVLIALAPLVLVAADEDAVKTELKKFEGKWKIVSAEQNGKPVPEEQIKDHPITVIKGNQMTFEGRDKGAATIKIDPTKKHIDVTGTERGTTFVVKGFYVVDGDTLKVSVNDPGKERPEAFSKGAKISVLKRENAK